MNKTLFYTLFLIIAFSFAMSAQDNPKDSTTAEGDTVITNTDSDWDEMEHNWDDNSRSWEKDYKNWEGNFFSFSSDPTISFNYGLSKASIKKLNSKFANPNLAELRIGFSELRDMHEFLVKYKYEYLELTNISTQLNNKTTTDLKSDLWRISAGWSKGYGYRIGDGAISLYNTTSLNWSRLNMFTNAVNVPDSAYLHNFDKSIRFGTSAEGGIAIKIIPQISVTAGYEKSAIFPRHMFWKWAGSAILEGIVSSSVDKFVEKIIDSSPAAAPIVNFVLKSGLEYGLYELRKEKMNWPFKSAAPLSYDQFKFGLSFSL